MEALVVDKLEEGDEEVALDHDWHFRYNRRLSCFSYSVSSVTFSQEGKYLVSGTGSGEIKVWDAGCWAEEARLRGSRHEGPKSIVISPGQRWLVCAYSTFLHVFQCHKPWRIEQSIPAELDPATKEPSEWCCIAFSPMSEVNHPQGHAGQDNHLAAFSTSLLCLMDYSNGWIDTPKRTRSLFSGNRPASIAYTSDGWWLVCGYENGQFQIWNAFSLTLERTMRAHDGRINCIVSSPLDAVYETRLISCGTDQKLRVWHSCGWALEQIVPDVKSDKAGVRTCSFSSSGNWLVSISSELCVWRICLTKISCRFFLRLHQRLPPVCGADGLCTAAFCYGTDAIASGSRDGVLSLWTKLAGMPPDASPLACNVELAAPSSKKMQQQRERQLAGPRPVYRVTPGGIKTPSSLLSQTHNLRPGASWLQQVQVRSTTMRAVGQEMVSPKNIEKKAGDAIGPSSLQKSQSTPELKRLSSQNGEYKNALSHMANQIYCNSTTALDDSKEGRDDPVSPIRKSMMHAASRLVKRISLDPKIIVDANNR